eukprot:TRINITY_DN74723_c0_g1_i1.p1 TRINITY_DN74723_c0_g1~~TRINITY_DN74723_c0_g1_i1.p1  ORF type:complete len:279 (-),score=50.40 TRINITY_DN74723_c0_g1_i1:66-902(-)
MTPCSLTTRPSLLTPTKLGRPAAQAASLQDGKPRFRLEVANQRRTFFGSDTQMKKSQWSLLPLTDAEAAALSSAPATPATPASASRQSTPPAVTPAQAQAALAAGRPPAWKPGAWKSGRRYVGFENAFGAPPLTAISDAALRSRIETLERGVLRARAEVGLYAQALLTRPTVHRGYVHENQLELEQELVVALAERDRRADTRRRRDEAEARRFRRITGASVVVQKSPKGRMTLGMGMESLSPGGASTSTLKPDSEETYGGSPAHAIGSLRKAVSAPYL